MTKKGLRDKRIYHAASSLYFHWASLYDKAFSEPVLLDKINSVIADDMVLVNIDGTLKGRAQFITRVQILKKWMMAIQHRSFRVTKVEGSTVFAVGEAIFQAIFPDFSCSEYHVNFHFTMSLPAQGPHQVKRLDVETLEYMKTHNFSDSYADSRTAAFLHHLLCQMYAEGGAQSVDLSGLFTHGASITLDGARNIETAGEIGAWLDDLTFSYKSPDGLPPPGFTATELPNGDLKFRVELDLAGRKAGAKAKPVRTVQDWILANNPADHLPQAKSVHILKIEPEKG